MFNNNKILVVIPARGGSKGIPRKNIRLLNHKPLISYAINIAKSSQYVDDIVVTTDDSEIALLSEKFGASVIRRSEELAGDEVPLDPVIYDAMVKKEKQAFDEYDLVVTLQPTSPLLKSSTLDAAIEKFEDFAIDSVLSVVDDRHLSWGYDENNERFFPNYIERKNRQYLPKDFRETGAILITRRNFVHEDSRLGTNLDLIEVSRQESVDIDNYEDWWIAENYLQKKKVAIVVNAYDEIGTGHVYRCLSIASKLVFHEVLFLMDEQRQLGIDIVGNYNYPYKLYDGEDDLVKILREYSPQIVVNDILDTSIEYVSQLKEDGYFVVNFEDLGTGTEAADVVFDALYEHDVGEKNIFTGHKYYILKDEFYFQPQKIIAQKVENILITFGGTDPNNFTEKVIDSILATSYDGRINVILGLGYDGLEELIDKYESNQSIQIYRNVSDISEFMFKADMIFTSAGRTMYEVCSLGVPTICLCQNERELTHVFANETNGFINMGLGAEVGKQQIIDEFVKLVNDYDLRLEMNQKMLNVDLKDGFENIWSIIREEYRKFELRGKKHENIQ
ncbi:MAG: UDP-2,4-diacetamido-2,4,6-trideoxy-beta-L-altropyranose hydrolase [Methanobrevibacter thaueri]|jgi:CMP-N-acetylneuraminic acid synthetase|uniref:UDP-2,4-diacetamido-2,4, 6-trideoxy-beta-L-altropyranose hydrolase n=1 Tax=Methanobrevibacter thaueri TaxID=190975 RepID=A0A8T3V4D3_9EURY|nr:UDP-2,4-diacetamido-2,4,6-trideoxy-beta-L-altropyranose hydrolase [Methanobrevibacter thaueri]MBE6501392.1 UDP-2,4-diacetamido-2,4,6-trideoxy-beta-L-altropyranose hydrolase [Methanobrevibacter thaueri]